MSFNGDAAGLPADDLEEFLQVYLDETSEQLDGLVEAMLALESDPSDHKRLQEAFRLIHSIKGSSAMMGFDAIAGLTHQLESHFDRLRSGTAALDQPTMQLTLACVDYLRASNEVLRRRQKVQPSAELFARLEQLLNRPESTITVPPSPRPVPLDAVTSTSAATTLDPIARPADPSPDRSPTDDHLAPVGERESLPSTTNQQGSPQSHRITIYFQSGLTLVDLKAELVLTRLENLGRVIAIWPGRDALAKVAEDWRLDILVESTADPQLLRNAADVGGVELIEVEPGTTTLDRAASASAIAKSGSDETAGPPHADAPAIGEPVTRHGGSTIAIAAATQSIDHPEPSTASSDAGARSSETMRVDIDRLDGLMNLAGELVVNRARFTQIARQLGPIIRKSNISSRSRSLSESLRTIVDRIKAQPSGDGRSEPHWTTELDEIESEINAIDEQARQWETGRRHFAQMLEAIDQLSRVSNSLQRGVLHTRMVPVAPLFNRFKRVVRDIALELGKQVSLEIRGEKTELDKRMIDELGDPLVHLVRNAIDHGIEKAEVRQQRGKPARGTIRLEASHTGNNVFIRISDDGGGFHVDRIRKRIIQRGLLPLAAVDQLSEQDVIEYIWHPGFSTAEQVSDISGRGVGMDIVKTRIAELSGTIEVQHSAGQGTQFTIRLPLTLAIIRSLLFRLRHGVFAVPIENVREIVSVPWQSIVAVHGRRTFDVRGEYLPLVDIDEIFHFHTDRTLAGSADPEPVPRGGSAKIVVLHAVNRTLGLLVSELHGSQDIVIKSLAENFVHIRGLSGASILGDGSVCLLLDAAAMIQLATDSVRRSAASNQLLAATT